MLEAGKRMNQTGISSMTACWLLLPDKLQVSCENFWAFLPCQMPTPISAFLSPRNTDTDSGSNIFDSTIAYLVAFSLLDVRNGMRLHSWIMVV